MNRVDVALVALLVASGLTALAIAAKWSREGKR